MTDTIDLMPYTAAAFSGAPWAITKNARDAIAKASRGSVSRGGLQFTRSGIRHPKLATRRSAPVAATLGGASAPGPDDAPGGVAVIPLCGVISAQGSFLDWLFGGMSGGLVGFVEDFTAAIESPTVSAVVLDVDSPGGVISLVPETAAIIRASRGTKPIIACANTLAASAAYWLAAQADRIVVTPSGQVGSVGSYVIHEDWSSFNEKLGVDPTWISAGKYKVDGNEDEPLSTTARADLQQLVNDSNAMFVADVAAGRGISTDDVVANYGEGRCFLAERAVAAGLADSVGSLASVVSGLLTQAGTPSAWALAPAPKLFTRAELRQPAPRADDPAAADEIVEQPHCQNCGKFISHGETLCGDCQEQLTGGDEPDDGSEGSDIDPEEIEDATSQTITGTDMNAPDDPDDGDDDAPDDSEGDDEADETVPPPVISSADRRALLIDLI